MNGRESDRRQLTLTCARTPSAGARRRRSQSVREGESRADRPGKRAASGEGGEERGVRRRRDFDEPPRRLDRRLDATPR